MPQLTQAVVINGRIYDPREPEDVKRLMGDSADAKEDRTALKERGFLVEAKSSPDPGAAESSSSPGDGSSPSPSPPGDEDAGSPLGAEDDHELGEELDESDEGGLEMDTGEGSPTPSGSLLSPPAGSVARRKSGGRR